MERSSNYYSSSLLSAYLSDPESGGPDSLPQINIEQPGYAGEVSIHSHPNQVNSDTLNSALSATSIGPQSSRMSVISSASTVGTSRSSVSALSDDLDLQSVRLKFEKIDTSSPRANPFKKLKQRILGEEKEVQPSGEDEEFFAYVNGKLKTRYYSYGKNETIDVKWADVGEVFFFGDTIDNLFADSQHLLNYLTQSAFELGEVRFSNLNRYHADRNHDVRELLRQLLPRVENLNGVLDLYAESNVNIERPELFETFSAQANHDEGLCIPLAISMFGSWLLSYNKDSAITSNYQNTLILDYFRKAARLSLVIRKVRFLLEENAELVGRSAYLELSRYWGKDNNNALATSLHGLGEYYQFLQNHNVAVTLWELNSHLTEDAESGHLAILGLRDGYGFGNHSKEHNAFGKRSRSHKFNAKRRIAHIYRILMKRPDFNEFGVSWATKDKYD